MPDKKYLHHPGKSEISPGDEDWNYVSGRCASREATLLAGDFYRELLLARTPAESYALVAESKCGEWFPALDRLTGYDRVLREELVREMRSIAADSPPDGPADVFLRLIELEDIHELLTGERMATGSPEGIRPWMERISRGFAWIGNFAPGKAGEGMFQSHPVRAVSLWVDSAYLASLLSLATVRPELGRYLRALVSLRAIGVCWRGLKSGIEWDWLEELFFRRELAAAGLRRPVRLENLELSRFLADSAPEGFRMDEDGFTGSYERSADNYLTRLAGEARYEPFGPGRLLHYLRQLWVEHFNLRVCLTAVFTPIPRETAEKRLRDA